MGVYLRGKYEVSGIILTGFRQGVILTPPPPQNEPPKTPTRVGLNILPGTSSHATLPVFKQVDNQQVNLLISKVTIIECARMPRFDIFN